MTMTNWVRELLFQNVEAHTHVKSKNYAHANDRDWTSKRSKR